MNENERRLLDSATTDHAWPLVELFSAIRREHPDDCNRAAQHLIDRLIFVNPGKYAHWGGGSYTWGTADVEDLPYKPGIPAVAVNNDDGKALIALAGKGGSATIVTRFETGWFRSLLPVVEIPGRREPGKFVLLHGHYDS